MAKPITDGVKILNNFDSVEHWTKANQMKCNGDLKSKSKANLFIEENIKYKMFYPLTS